MAGTVLPTCAAAGTVKLVRQPGDGRIVPTELLRYSALPGEPNGLRVDATRRDGTILVTDSAGVALGRGCVRVVATYPTRASCSAPRDLEISDISVDLGDRDDVFRLRVDPRANLGFEAEIAGGPGDDSMTGGRLMGGPGNDRLSSHLVNGGPDSDILMTGGRGGTIDESDPGNGSDVIRGGSGPTDQVIYTARRAPVAVDLRATSGAGEAGENDRITGIENAQGGAGDDVLIGTDAPNNLEGGAGTDAVSGGRGNDFLFGGFDSAFPGGPGERDSLDGGPGDDAIFGSPGPNLIQAGPGQDTVFGFGGSDSIVSDDASADNVACGASSDAVRADALDFAPRSCERVQRRGNARAIPLFIAYNSDVGGLGLYVGCSIDGPRVCRGTAKIYRNGLRETRRFRGRRGQAKFVRLRSPKRVLKRARVLVTARDRGGRSRRVARTLGTNTGKGRKVLFPLE